VVTSSPTDASTETGTPACRAYDGPVHVGEIANDDFGVTTSEPACAPRCGAPTVFDGFLSIEALPTGSCTTEPTCVMAAVPKCGCGDRGPVNTYRCRCTSGRWECLVADRGGDICPATCEDTGPMCFSDFPCMDWQRWSCTDEMHAVFNESKDCTYRCGATPCSGGSCEPTGEKVTCAPGTHCVDQKPDWMDGGLRLDEPCQRIAVDAGPSSDGAP
jgi:hypothetical protein